MTRNLSAPEPAPRPGGGLPLWSMVIIGMPAWLPKGSPGCKAEIIEPLVEQDMRDRDASGRSKYGVPLTAHNGRDALVDAYQECLDGIVYATQAVTEGVAVELATAARQSLLVAAMGLRLAIYERDGR